MFLGRESTKAKSEIQTNTGFCTFCLKKQFSSFPRKQQQMLLGPTLERSQKLQQQPQGIMVTSQDCGGSLGTGHRAHEGKGEDMEWIPISKLGRLVLRIKRTSPWRGPVFSRCPSGGLNVIGFFEWAPLKSKV